MAVKYAKGNDFKLIAESLKGKIKTRGTGDLQALQVSDLVKYFKVKSVAIFPSSYDKSPVYLQFQITKDTWLTAGVSEKVATELGLTKDNIDDDTVDQLLDNYILWYGTREDNGESKPFLVLGKEGTPAEALATKSFSAQAA